MDPTGPVSGPSADPAELIRARLAGLSAEEAQLEEELAAKKGERKRYEVALAALTGESRSGRCVTRQRVHDELAELLAATPQRAVVQKALDSELRSRLKAQGLKLIGFSRRLAEVLASDDFVVDRGKVRLLTNREKERSDGVA